MADEITEEPIKVRTVLESLLYKLDRTSAVLGIIGIAIVALLTYSGAEGVQIATAAIGGLVGYIGGRAASK